MTISVVQSWLSDCSLKQQTVLLSALRGCDGRGKNDPSKKFTKWLRTSILLNADPKTTFYGPPVELNEENQAIIDDFFVDCSRGSLDEYPTHWFLHMLQAAEIIGYKCPYPQVAAFWIYYYLSGIRAMHVNPETESQLDIRLADNVESPTCAWIR